MMAPNVQISIPAARVSIMVNSAFLLGKDAISADQYNLICTIMEGGAAASLDGKS